MSKKYYVYEHWLDGRCFYVGKGCESTNRAYNFYDYARHRDWVKIASNRKDEIEVRIIKEFDNENEAYIYEEEHCLKMKQQGYNIVGGKDGHKLTEEERLKRFGEGNPFYGKTHSKQFKKEQSERAKLFIGENNPFYGKEGPWKGKKNPEHSKRVKGDNNPRARSVVQLTKDGKFIKKFNTAKEAGEHINKSSSNITTCCKNKKGTVGGYVWKYESDYMEVVK